MGIKLSLLDQNIIYEGETATSTLSKTVALAQTAETLGYDTFYVAEHHLIKEIAGAAPEILISYLLASTKHIKVGAAGVMLQHYVPFKVAESFSVLQHLAPHRVVLGIGKAQGGKDEAVQLLQRDYVPNVQSFDEKFVELLHFIRNDFASNHPYTAPEYTLEPQFTEHFAVDLLGGSQESAKLATAEQTGLIYPYFVNAKEDVLAQTRAAYRSSEAFKIAVIVYITEDPLEANRYLREQASYTVLLANGKRLNFNDQQTAEEYASQYEQAQVIEQQVGAFVGNAQEIKNALLDFADRFDTEHFVIHTPGVPYEKKIDMIHALAHEFKGE